MFLQPRRKKGISTVKSYHLLCLVVIGLTLTSGCRLHFQDGYMFDYTGVQTKVSTSTPISGNITQLQIENKFGDVLITHDPTRAMECRWEGTVWADNMELAEVFISELKMTPTEVGEVLTLTLTMPEDDQALNGIKSNLSINVPRSMQVTSTNTHGNTQVSQLDGASQIVNAHGNVAAKNVNVVDIECRHGDVTLANTMGESSVVTSHGNITVANTKNLKVDATHTDIFLQNSLGDVQLATTHGDIEVSNVQGFLSIDNRHGDIDANAVAGQVVAKTTHATVNISGDCSALEVDCTHGNINAQLYNADFQSIDLETTHSNIVLTVPPNANINVNADEDDLRSEIQSSPTGAPVDLSVSHGTITVKAGN